MSKQRRTHTQSISRHLIRPFGHATRRLPPIFSAVARNWRKPTTGSSSGILAYWSSIKVVSKSYWGILEKRQPVSWAGEDAPSLVGKSEEGLGEILSQMPNVDRA